MMKFLILPAVVALSALAACGGGGSSSDPAPAPTPADAVVRAKALNTEYAATTATVAAAMPVTGQASYTGAAVFGKGTDMDALLQAPTMSGDMALNADFATGTVTGGIDNFRDAANAPVSGQMTVSGAQIAGAVLGGDLAGTVGGKDVNAQMSGSFLGTDAEAVRGVIADGAGAAGAFNGAFIVAR